MIRDLIKLTLGAKGADRYDRLRYWKNVLEVSSRGGDRECPACGYVGQFRANGYPPRYNAECPSCGSWERHRLLCLAIEQRALISSGAKIIHFAPEDIIEKIVKRYDVEYYSADLRPGRAAIVLNIENIELADGSVDIVIVNHVLEHVNDHLALKEIHRILRPGGHMLASVPLIEGWDSTYENELIHTPQDREWHFGQDDHVRFYGRDFRDRIRNSGLKLTEFVGGGADTVRYGLLRGERIFIGTK